jgi:hypothetical protein
MVWVWLALVANAVLFVSTVSAFWRYQMWHYISPIEMFHVSLGLIVALINVYVITRAFNLKIESKKTPAT